jgi:hypothetical protein
LKAWSVRIILGQPLKEDRMKKVLLAGVAALTIAGSTVVYAQHRPWFQGQTRMSPEDRAAFLDARIAAVHAGLKLTADQEKLWPPVEAAVRDFAKMRIDRANARMATEKNDADTAQRPDDPVARLRARADNMAATAGGLKKIADAADPLYKMLDDNQKRRLTMLTHMEGRGFGAEGWRRHRMERGMDRWERNGRGGPDQDRDGGPDQERSGRL